MSDRALAPSSYKKLVSDITALYEGARRALVAAYWEIGQRIVEVEQKGEIKAAYGAGLLPKLSADLTEKLGSGFSVESLVRMRRFYLNHPKKSPATKLPWAHHIELLAVRDKRRRLALEKRAGEEDLDRDSLRRLVRKERAREIPGVAGIPTPGVDGVKPPKLLAVPKPGIVNTYLIKPAGETAWPEKDALLLDHGFKNYRVLIAEESRGLAAGDIVEWTGESFRETDRTTKDLYTYSAYVEKVIDGDTFWVVLDTGMRTFSRQKLRLRGVDCPEIKTAEGRSAKKLVEALLRDVPELTVLTRKNDKYDRYEADVWFTDGEGNERYLNNLLLETGHAIRVDS